MRGISAVAPRSVNLTLQAAVQRAPRMSAWDLEKHSNAHLCGRHGGRRCRISRLLNAQSSVPPSVQS
jgi:hypothetical protein